MGFFDFFKAKHPVVNTKSAVNVEWVLKALDDIGTASKTSMGFALQLPNETATTKYLRQDGTWEVPYTHPTTSGNKHVPSGGSSGQILRWSSDGTATWGADNNMTYSAGTGLSLSGTTFVLNIDIIYPIGSIYLSVNNSNPGTWLPGTTWTAWGSGRVPVGVNTNDTSFNTVEKTGGAKTHTLTNAEMPSHSHTQQGTFDTSTTGSHNHSYIAPVLYNGDATANESGGEVGEKTKNTEYSGNHKHSVTVSGNTKQFGDGNAHNNLQPYITCYMWKRIE
jgi:microcystin-dependent protein